MHHTPGQGLHGRVNHIGAGACHLEDGGHGETGAGMAVVLHDDMGILFLDFIHQLAQQCGTADAGHVLQGNLVGAEFHQLIYNAHVVLHRVDGGVGDAEGRLADHAGLLGILDGKFKVAHVVQSAERAHDVHTLCLLHLGHQLAHVLGHAIHAKAVQRTLQHVGLDAGLVELFGPGTDGFVGVLTIHEVHLLKGTSVGLDAVEATHFHDSRCHLH